MAQKPVIGITSAFDYDKSFAYVKTGYYKGILKAGGLPVIIPAMEETDVLEELVDTVDGILLTGGPDLDARLFGEVNLPCNGSISPVRDTMEIYLARKTVERNKPLLGICRGAQLINVAFGGTLYQDIPSQIQEPQVLKHDQAAPAWYPFHDIYIEEGSRVSRWFTTKVAGVNSFHHQAVNVVAPGFIVTAKTEDGIIEAIESRNHPFVVGVQWHPEAMWEQNPALLAGFMDFVESCRKKG